jgi:hypothetical protein
MAVLVGFESMTFAVFSKMFATTERLLPEDPRLTRWYKYITLEVGLIVGALLILGGAGLWVFGLEYWRSQQFGPLDPEKTLRIVIPAFLSVTMGVQVVLSSFFMSVLGLARR